MRSILILLFVALGMAGCGVGKSSFSPTRKYSLQEVQKDYTLYQEILESHHPSLYWYTPKDSMEYYFRYGQRQLKDSMSEPEFRKVLNYVTSKISCGHTSVRPSKKWAKYIDTASVGRLFPLSLKLWEDTTVVVGNLNRRDSILKRGTIITAIKGRPISELADTLFNYISTDGYNRTHKFQTLSNRGVFGSTYTALFGVRQKYKVSYIDTVGRSRSDSVSLYSISPDTSRRLRPPFPQPSKKERKKQVLRSRK